jgi:hypothetical protein
MKTIERIIDIVTRHREELLDENPSSTLDEMLEEPLELVPDNLKVLQTHLNANLVKEHNEMPQYLVYMSIFYSRVLSCIPEDRNRDFFIDYVKHFLIQFSGKTDRKSAKSIERKIKGISDEDIRLFIEKIRDSRAYFGEIVNKATVYCKEQWNSNREYAFRTGKTLPGLDEKRWHLERDIRHRYIKSIGVWLTTSVCYGKGSYAPKMPQIVGLFYCLPKKFHGYVELMFPAERLHSI